MVALQALAQYAAYAYGEDMDMMISVQGSDLSATFDIDTSNSLLLQTEELTVPNNLNVRATGTGCAFVQVFASNKKFGKALLSAPREFTSVEVILLRFSFNFLTCRQASSTMFSTLLSKSQPLRSLRGLDEPLERTQTANIAASISALSMYNSVCLNLYLSFPQP